jgi:hypothetical protein
MTDKPPQPAPIDPLVPHSMSPRELKALLATERAGSAFLVYRDGAGALQMFALSAHAERISVGRRDGVGLRLAWDTEVSGIHAELQCVAGEWTLVDDGLSTNGTLLNAQHVTGRHRLRNCDRILIGQTLLAYDAAAITPTPETAIAQSHPAPQQLSPTQRRILIALCRPVLTDGDLHAPTTNHQIADEICLGIDAVKMQLRSLFGKYGLDHLPQSQKRAGLAELALRSGLVSRRDLQ